MLPQVFTDSNHVLVHEGNYEFAGFKSKSLPSYFFVRFGGADFTKALDILERAIDQTPTFTSATVSGHISSNYGVTAMDGDPINAQILIAVDRLARGYYKLKFIEKD